MSGAGTIGKISRVPAGIKKGVFNQALIRLRLNSNITDSEFYLQWMRSDSMQHRLRDANPGSAMVNLVPMSEIKKWDVVVPNKKEQRNIGSLLKKVDNLITIYKNQLSLYESMKKGMLQAIFPNSNQDISKIRFNEFNDSWRFISLSKISNKVTEKNKDNIFNDTFTNSAEHGIIRQRDFFDKDISNKMNLNNYYIVRENDFVYNPRISNSAPVGPINRNKLNSIGVMSPLYYVFRTHDIDNAYLECYFDTSYWHKFMKANGDSGARSDRLSIKDKIFQGIPIPYPTLEEQENISNLFKILNHLIYIQSHNLDRLKKLKKYYLKEMFV